MTGVQTCALPICFEQASPIQAAAIPVLLTGKDIVGQSMTGSGKTAAFGVPAVEKVDVTKREVQVLILCPTRELAVQVSEEIHKLSFFKRGVNSLPIYGGQSYDRQLYGLKQGAQIVIGTPGRVMDHMRRGTLKLTGVKMVILDEADVMLNMGFREDIELILAATPKERQTVFFSATMPKPIRDLIEKNSREPQSVKIEQKAMTVPTVDQVYFEVDRRYKMELLTRLIDIYDLKLGIVFCNTKRMVDDLVDHLEAAGYQADRFEMVHEVVHHALGVAENDAEFEVVNINEPREQFHLVAAVHLEINLVHRRHGHRLLLDLDALRFARIFFDQVANWFRHRGGKENRLPFLRCRGENQFDVLAETHVQHHVGLVENDHLHAGEFQRATAHMIHHEIGRAHV